MSLYNAWGFNIDKGLPTYSDPSPDPELLWENHGKSYINIKNMPKWYSTIKGHGTGNLSKDLKAKGKTISQFDSDYKRLLVHAQSTESLNIDIPGFISSFYNTYHIICGNLPQIPIISSRLQVFSQWDLIHQSTGDFQQTVTIGHSETQAQINSIGAKIGAEVGSSVGGLSAKVTSEISASRSQANTVTLTSESKDTVTITDPQGVKKIFQLWMILREFNSKEDIVEKQPIYRTCNSKGCDLPTW